MLRAKKNLSRYKSVDAAIDAVYRNNRDLISQGLLDVKQQAQKHEYSIYADLPVDSKSTRSIFKRWIKDLMAEDDMTLGKAIKTFSKSEIVRTKAERLEQNFLKGLRNDKEAFKQFREAIGYSTKIDPNKFKYDYVDKAYRYEGTYVFVKYSKDPTQQRFVIKTYGK